MLKHHSPAKSGHSIIKKEKKKLCETCALSASTFVVQIFYEA